MAGADATSSRDNGVAANVVVVATDDAEARAAIAAKLKRAAQIPVAKLLNGGDGGGPRAKSQRRERKLLHWSAEQWLAFEKTPPVARLLPTARMLPMRSPLSSLYVVYERNMAQACV